jgi:hypothetical protein
MPLYLVTNLYISYREENFTCYITVSGKCNIHVGSLWLVIGVRYCVIAMTPKLRAVHTKFQENRNLVVCRQVIRN